MDNSVVLDVWIGGEIVWFPTVKYSGGRRVGISCNDRDKLCYSNLLDMYNKVNGKASSVKVYSNKPGKDLGNGLVILKTNDDLLLWLEDYKGLPTIPLYFDDEHGVDVEGQSLPTEQEGFQQQLQEPQVQQGNDPDIENDEEYMPSSDDSDSSSNSSSNSSTPSWMLEDLEGPDDDDIFVNKPSDHGRKILKMVRDYIRNKKKKNKAEARAVEQANIRNEDEGWYTDGEADNATTFDGLDEWDDSIDMRNFELTVGFKFPNRETFKRVLKDWSVRNGFDLKYPKCEAKIITAKCKSGCNWSLRASTIQNDSTFQIKTIKGTHTCAYRTTNTQAGYMYLGRRIFDVVKDNPNEKVDGLQKKISRDCGVDCSLHKVYRAKKHALSLLSVDVGLQYARLYDYCLTVEKHNPESSLIVKVNRELYPPKFQRMYVCLAPMKEAFLSGCRPIIGLDGCFLKGLHAGQLLSAVGRDGNDNMLPIAIAYVEVEKQDTWKWFLELLFRDIGSPNDSDWTFISDRQKGLIEAVHELAPNSEHMFCVKHMYNNFKSKFSGLELKKLFWKAASTYSVKHHLRIMKEIERLSPKRGKEQTPYESLANVPAQHWARCFFPTTSKCDVIVNNLSESFNSYILPARDLTIIDMFEWIRKKFMTRLQVKRAGMERYNEIVCPNIISKIEAQRAISRHYYASWAGEDKFEVNHNLDNYIVYLKEGHCICGMFQLCGYPCCHAIACISLHRLDVTEFVSDFFKKEVYMRVYSRMINPVPGMNDYEESGKGPIDPPDVRIKRGRPKKKRRLDGNDKMPNGKALRKGLTTTCGACGGLGHNKRGCPKKQDVQPGVVPEIQVPSQVSEIVHSHGQEESLEQVIHQSTEPTEEERLSRAFQENFGWAIYHEEMPQQNSQNTIASNVENPSNIAAPKSRKQQKSTKRNTTSTQPSVSGSQTSKFKKKK